MQFVFTELSSKDSNQRFRESMKMGCNCGKNKMNENAKLLAQRRIAAAAAKSESNILYEGEPVIIDKSPTKESTNEQ